MFSLFKMFIYYCGLIEFRMYHLFVLYFVFFLSFYFNCYNPDLLVVGLAVCIVFIMSEHFFIKERITRNRLNLRASLVTLSTLTLFSYKINITLYKYAA